MNHREIVRTWQNILPEWPHAITAQCVTQIRSDQYDGASLIPIWGPDPAAEAPAEGINHFEIARPWRNISQEWPHAIRAQCVARILSDPCGGTCLIQIWGADPSAEAQGIDHFKIGRPWPNISQECPHAIMDQCMPQMWSDQHGGACLIPF
jgi:hypothetical protein